jgi:hypothetical protein
MSAIETGVRLTLNNILNNILLLTDFSGERNPFNVVHDDLANYRVRRSCHVPVREQFVLSAAEYARMFPYGNILLTSTAKEL